VPDTTLSDPWNETKAIGAPYFGWLLYRHRSKLAR
jgi:hypothetical protein